MWNIGGPFPCYVSCWVSYNWLTPEETPLSKPGTNRLKGSLPWCLLFPMPAYRSSSSYFRQRRGHSMRTHLSLLPTPSSNDLPPSVSKHFQDIISAALTSAYSTASIKKRNNAIHLFYDFVTNHGLTSSAMLPAAETTLSAFAASLAETRSGSTIRGIFSALKGWHTDSGVSWCGGPTLALVLRSCDKRTPRSSMRPPKQPVTLAMLTAINKGLNRDDGLDACIRMVCNVAFFGQLRLGEIVHPRQDMSFFNSSTHSVANNLEHCGPQYKLFIPFTKTAKARGDSITIPPHNSICDPGHSIRVHLAVNGIYSSSDVPLVSYRDRQGVRWLLTRHVLLNRINAILSAKGLDNVMGHSFRVGGTSFYLLAGVPPDVVKAMGRWKSDAFLVYWRFVDEIVSVHLRNICDVH
jgi:hypothetical protein